MRYLSVLIFILLFSSCQYFGKEKINAEDILNEELKMFDWNDVDQYPSFSVCDFTSSKSERKACFENTLLTHINSTLETDNIVVSEVVHDTILLTFQISEKGELAVKNIETNTFIKSQIPNIEELLVNSIEGLPTVFPAIKRGQQVKTEFRLPFIVRH